MTRSLTRAVAPPLFLATAALSDPAADLALSVTRAADLEPGRALDAAVGKALDHATAEKEAEYLAILDAMGRLAETAEHPATRAVMRDLHRQIVANLIGRGVSSDLIALLDEVDPLLSEIFLGVGLAQSDVAAGAVLAELHARLPDDPRTLDPEAPELADHARALLADYAAQPPHRQQMFARANAWLAGTLAAWPEMDAEMRRQATGILVSDEPPGADVVEAVTGASDLLFWLGSLEMALTPEERAAEPELVAFIESGEVAAGAGEAIAARIAGIALLSTQAATLGTMMDLNYDLMFGDARDMILQGP